jgi:ribosomal protein S18 acetylase RimI-like enzyme
VTIRVEAIEGYPDDDLVENICTILSDQPPYPIELFKKKLKHQTRILGCYAYDQQGLVGYKIGYEPRPRYFESWQGAVGLDHRRQGIAERLMNIQHEWCKENNYRIITTITAASNNPMLILNLKAGFMVSGTLLDRGENHQVLLQKIIGEDSTS